MRAITDCHLYGILDLGYVTTADASAVARKMVTGGIDILQLRAKGHPPETIATLGKEAHAITAPAGVPLVINDHPALARETGAEGVHVGQDDISIAEARSLAGPGVFVGKSTHSPTQAAAAQDEGADYIGFGPLFATPTKPGYTAIGTADIAPVHADVWLPIFCIGGIKDTNLSSVVAAGARRAVIVSGILQSDDIPLYIRRARAILTPLG